MDKRKARALLDEGAARAAADDAKWAAQAQCAASAADKNARRRGWIKTLLGWVGLLAGCALAIPAVIFFGSVCG